MAPSPILPVRIVLPLFLSNTARFDCSHSQPAKIYCLPIVYSEAGTMAKWSSTILPLVTVFSYSCFYLRNKYNEHLFILNIFRENNNSGTNRQCRIFTYFAIIEQMLRGVTFILLAEFCFAMATVFANILPLFRRLLPFQIFHWFSYHIFISGHMDIHQAAHWRRTLQGCIQFYSLICFIRCNTSVTNANMLNMTYPVFVFMIAPLFWKQKIKWVAVLFLFITILGIYLVIRPDFSHVNIGDVWGLLSGLVAAFAVITLSIAREHDSTAIIVFYLMAFGFIFNGFMMIPAFIMPRGIQYTHLLASVYSGYGAGF